MKDEKEQKNRWGKIRHLFSKAIVVLCICMGVRCSVWAMQIVEETGAEPSATLAVIMAFFGGELLFLCMKTIMGDKKE